MLILPLTLSESAGTFVGLESQALIRDALGVAPALVILSGSALIVLGIIRGGRPLADLGIYLFVSLLILSLLWPRTETVSPSDVEAQAAAGEAISNAGELLPGRASLAIPRVELDLLTAISSMWVNVARAINVEGDRPFSEIAPISWLMQQRLKSATISDIRDWTTACIMPARTMVLNTSTNAGYEDLLPFSGTVLNGVMSTMTRTVRAGSVNCGSHADTIMSMVSSEVEAFLTPGGFSMTSVWSEEIGLSPEEVTQFLIMREVTRASGPEIQPVGLVGLYAGVRAISGVGGGLYNAAIGALSGNLGRASEGLANALTGGAPGAIGDLVKGIEGLVGRALFVTKFSSDIVGVLQAVVLAIFPFVVLVALTPGRHVITLVAYGFLIIAVYSMPFAWALVDLLSDIALAPTTIAGVVSEPIAALEAYASALVIVTIGTWVALFGLAFAILLPVAGAGVGFIRAARGV